MDDSGSFPPPDHVLRLCGETAHLGGRAAGHGPGRGTAAGFPGDYH